MRGATSLGGRWQAANPVAAYICAVNCFRNARISNANAQPLIEIEHDIFPKKKEDMEIRMATEMSLMLPQRFNSRQK